MSGITLAGVSKRYRRTTATSLIDVVTRRGKASEFLALRDLDLDVAAGDAVGVLGHNGAGKTTLLRLLAGVTRPTSGRLRVEGQIAPLIGVGVGFHQELSGRENVFVNGMLLGRHRAELRRDFDEIVAFSGLTGVLDTPVKFYSSGMLLRLAFSVAIHTEPEVLLVDELLAVGDAAFQTRCLERMHKLRAAGTTLVLVSHSAYVVRMLCPRAIVLKRGEKVFDGPSDEAVAVHLELLGGGADPDGVTRAELTERHLVGPGGEATGAELEEGARYHLRYRLRFLTDVDSPQVFFTVYGETGDTVYQAFSQVGDRYRHFEAGEETDLDIAFTSRLGGGTFQLTVQVLACDGRSVLCQDASGLFVRRPRTPGIEGPVELESDVVIS